MRLEGFFRVHVLPAHEPARRVSADREHRDVDRPETPAVLGEAGEVAGVAREEIAALARIDQPRAPERSVGPDLDPARPVLRRKAGDRPAPAHRALPPVELDDVGPLACAEPVCESERHEPLHARGQRVDRVGVEVVVVRVRDHRERVRRHRAERDPRRHEPRGDQRAIAEVRIGEDHVGAVVDREGGVSDPGEGGAVLDPGEAAAVVGSDRDHGRATLVVGVAREQLPAQEARDRAWRVLRPRREESRAAHRRAARRARGRARERRRVHPPRARRSRRGSPRRRRQSAIGSLDLHGARCKRIRYPPRARASSRARRVHSRAR